MHGNSVLCQGQTASAEGAPRGAEGVDLRVGEEDAARHRRARRQVHGQVELGAGLVPGGSCETFFSFGRVLEKVWYLETSLKIP